MNERTRDDIGTYDDISAAAVRTTGLSDFGGDEHEEGLRIFAESLANEGGLTPVGNYRLRGMVKGALVARLLSQHGFSEHPEHSDVPIERPIFVTGLPRSGTTLVQRLLTADPRHQGLEQWLTDLPQPRPPRETWAEHPIFSAMQAGYQAFHESNPEMAGLHYSDAASHEECWRLLQQAGTSVAFETQAHVPTYSRWLDKQDWTPAYRRHRQLLQLIGLNDADRRWVLKNPSHLIALDALLEVYPDAIILITHRDPVTCVASMCSLAEASSRGTSTVFTGATIGSTQLDLLVREQAAYRAARAAAEPGHFLDVAYDDLVRDPVGTIAGVYATFDLPWDAKTEAAIRAGLEESRSGVRRPSHSYSLADYGLTEAGVHEALGP